MDGLSLGLEPDWGTTISDSRIDCLAELIIWDSNQRKHLVKTCVHGRFVAVDGTLPKAAAYTFLDALVVRTGSAIRLQVDSATYVMHHVIPGIDSFTNIVETFSGLGIMSSGLIEAGGMVQTKNELRATFIQHQSRMGSRNLVEGDLGQNEVLYNLWKAYPKSGFLTAGFSCQPWSKLGDGRGMNDERAKGLKSVLRAAYFLRSSGLLLECVTGAGCDAQVRLLIQQWCECTGFKASDITLSLHDVWPAKRDRWWCLVTSALIPRVSLTPWPRVEPPPTVASILPVFPKWTDDDIHDITLDLYEVNKFIEYDTLYGSLIKLNEPMPTALHGWSVQLQACPCGCRNWPLSHDRLKSKGLHGALVGLDHTMDTLLGEIQAFRHAHPWEIALLNGVPPNQDWLPLRQGICGLGQMASPLQAAWVMAHYTWELSKVFEWDLSYTPEQVVWRMMTKLMEVRNEVVPENLQHSSVHSFTHSLYKALGHSHTLRFIPPSVSEQTTSNVNFPDLEVTCPWVQISKKDRCVQVGLEKEKDEGETEEKTDLVKVNPMVALGSVEDASWDGHEGNPDQFQIKGDNTIHEKKETIGGEVVTDVQPKSSGHMEVYSSHGGICAFSTKTSPRTRSTKRMNPEDAEEPRDERKKHRCLSEERIPQVKQEEEDGNESFSPLLKIHIRDIEKEAAKEDSTMEQVKMDNVILVYRDDSWAPEFLKVSHDQSVGSITVADDKLTITTQPVSVVDAVGSHIRAIDTTTPFQQVFLHYSPSFNTREKIHGMPPSFVRHQHEEFPRLTILSWQEGWVSQDEMDFYLEVISSTLEVPFVPSFAYQSNDESLNEWVTHCSNQVHQKDKELVFSACLVDHHWIPVVFHQTDRKCDDPIAIISTEEGSNLIADRCQGSLQKRHIQVLMHEDFPNDCGFQTINMILHVVKGEVNEDVPACSPFTPKEAICWRTLFAHHLKLTGKCSQMCRPFQMHFGGTKNDEAFEHIRDLLIKHGVPETEVNHRCNLVFDKVGRPSMLKVIRSNRPWAELKALANSQAPKLQLVLPSELESIIKQRANQGKPFGEKKIKQEQKRDATKISLTPDAITIPVGMFKQGQNELIGQVPLTAIGSETSGVVIVNSQQAQPYLKLATPVSKHGLGLLILDHDASSVQSVGSVIRFPARCEITSEPVIVTARLVQLGNSEVSRHVPVQPLKIEEADTVVIRVIVYQDEFPHDWSLFVQQPVKQILQSQPLLNSPTSEAHGVVDVWDRQFLGNKYDKQPPQKASIFMVNVRLVGVDVRILMQSSGNSGIYYEPRSHDGRHPDGNYRVIWLTKTEKATALSAQQTTDNWSCLVRAGQRYGIRTTWDHAPNVHAKHKPNVPYLDAVDVLTFSAGPFPYGATKGSLQKIFGEWKWPARPVQPKGRSPDGTGVIWEIQASQHPQYEVYALEHSDILITEVTKKKGQDPIRNDIVASAKTIAALKTHQINGSSGANCSSSSEDPLVRNDPWQAYTPPSKVAKPLSHVSQDNLVVQQTAIINAAVDRKVAAVVAELDNKYAKEDVDMPGPDSRIHELESRLSSLESTVQQQAQKTTQYQTHVAQQISSLQQKVEQQGGALQAHMDARMREQMDQIERLLTKKQRNE